MGELRSPNIILFFNSFRRWGIFMMFLVEIMGFFKFSRLLLNVTKVSIEHQTWPIIGQNSIISLFCHNPFTAPQC